ncbi:MAG: Plug domain-containing protein, partial [Alphaproteobacteria bacterium]|nr:Plug domain-containing protein [Alphaproteobacteria bacterium]
MVRKPVVLSLVAVALGTTSLVPPAWGQGLQIEEIVVTARKRSENLLDIPLAISAFTTQQMEKIGSSNLVELAKFTPGIQFNEQGVQEPGRVYTSIRFRGLGSEIKEPFGQ